MIAYAPVFAAVSAAGGGITSSALYSMAIIGSAQLAVELSKSIIQPLLSVMLALGIAEGLEDLSLLLIQIPHALTSNQIFLIYISIAAFSLFVNSRCPKQPLWAGKEFPAMVQ